VAGRLTVHVASPAPTTTTAVRAMVSTAPTTSAPVVLASTSTAGPSVAALVAEVEATGLEPGSNWSWSMGNPASHCPGLSGLTTGCTYGAVGLEVTLFAGNPTLALVAHEIANAETENDAVPDVLNQVEASAGGTSWSAIDAVASCLVEHYLGVQDDVAGSWQCSSAMAASVAANIHDNLSSTVQITS
jgi:hypothetical protein